MYDLGVRRSSRGFVVQPASTTWKLEGIDYALRSVISVLQRRVSSDSVLGGSSHLVSGL